MVQNSIAARLLDLTATQFENLSYDLLVLCGLRNVVWRTPGPDGGRDIEGDWFAGDFSGELRRQRWYVECKRYENTLSWPLLREKLAYAENHRADFLLLISTSEVSPKCRDEISTWNSDRRLPTVRTWVAAQLVGKLRLQPSLLAKYRLEDGHETRSAAAAPLALLGQKAVQAAYGAASAAEQIDPALEYSAALMELVYAWLELDQTGREHARHDCLYQWCIKDPNVPSLNGYDVYGLRAVLSALRLISRCETVGISAGDDANSLKLAPQLRKRQSLHHELLRSISLWSNIETVVQGANLIVRKRACNG